MKSKNKIIASKLLWGVQINSKIQNSCSHHWRPTTMALQYLIAPGLKRATRWRWMPSSWLRESINEHIKFMCDVMRACCFELWEKYTVELLGVYRYKHAIVIIKRVGMHNHSKNKGKELRKKQLPWRKVQLRTNWPYLFLNKHFAIWVCGCTHTHTHAHTLTLYIQKYICVYVCVFFWT